MFGNGMFLYEGAAPPFMPALAPASPRGKEDLTSWIRQEANPDPL